MGNIDSSSKYDDIINMTHPQSTTHAHMSIHDRAAQFAPFAALTGHGDAIKETARRTDQKIELDESGMELLNYRLQIIRQNMEMKSKVEYTYFVPDEEKTGGKYLSATGVARKIDDLEHMLYLEDGRMIPIENLLLIEGEMFYTIEI